MIRSPRLDRRTLLRGLLGVAATGAASLALPADAGADIWIGHDLSDPNLVFVNRRYGIRVLDAEGQFVAARKAYYGPPVPFERLPKHLVNALVTQEDRRFFQHRGIDLFGILRAAKDGLTSLKIKQGGSTITQQVLKDLFYRDDWAAERKVKELINASTLEQHQTKEQILYLYLNRVLFGRSAHGIEAAARLFFGKYAVDLTVMEAAMLVTALPAPNARNPRRGYDRSIARARRLIDTMVELGHLPKTAGAKAKQERPKLAPDLEAGGGYHRGSVQSGWFAQWVEDEADRLSPLGDGVSTIETTLDLTLQRSVEKIVGAAIGRSGKQFGFDQGAAVVMSLRGDVLAMVGGHDYRTMQFNIATQARRQPGSAFKPLVFLAAIERGLKPEDMVSDTPLTLGAETIRNLDGKYRGTITAEAALAYSSNVVPVRLARGHVPEIAQLAKRLGVKSKLTGDLGLALGISEMGLLELTAVYAAIANGGLLVVPSAVTRIRNNVGTVVFARQGTPDRRVIQPDHAATLRGMLAKVVEYGTGTQADPGFWAAGKTGTTDDHRDAWFIGFTRDHVAGVWLGNRDSSPTKGMTGGGLPAKIWRAIMVEAHRTTSVGRSASAGR